MNGNNNKELGIINDNGVVEPFKSSELRICLYCGIPITEENFSGWDVSTETPRLTCPICKDCEYVVDSRCPDCGWEGHSDSECGITEYPLDERSNEILDKGYKIDKIPEEETGKHVCWRHDRCPKCDTICEYIGF